MLAGNCQDVVRLRQAALNTIQGDWRSPKAFQIIAALSQIDLHGRGIRQARTSMRKNYPLHREGRPHGSVPPHSDGSVCLRPSVFLLFSWWKATLDQPD